MYGIRGHFLFPVRLDDVHLREHNCTSADLIPARGGREIKPGKSESEAGEIVKRIRWEGSKAQGMELFRLSEGEVVVYDNNGKLLGCDW